MKATELNIHAAMAALSQKRRIFHLEGDFQFALAWELQSQCSSHKIRLEKPVYYDEDWCIDIEVRADAGIFPIELKYLKKALVFEDIDGTGKEKYILAQGVHDIEMYSCFADIARLEKHCRETPGVTAGYALWLTNDPKYWDEHAFTSYYKPFHPYEGSRKSGELYFNTVIERTGKPPKIRNMKGYTEPVFLNGSYLINWHDYSDLGVPGGKFKYTVVRV